MKSSVETLREEIDRLRGGQSYHSDLDPEQRSRWVELRVAVLEAQIAEDEYLDSLLDRRLTDDERQAIVDDLYEELVDSMGRDAADMADFAHESDWALVHDHERFLEAREAEGVEGVEG